jgi:hypothetical protein
MERSILVLHEMPTGGALEGIGFYALFVQIRNSKNKISNCATLIAGDRLNKLAAIGPRRHKRSALLVLASCHCLDFLSARECRSGVYSVHSCRVAGPSE